VKALTAGKGANVILDPILASNFDYNMNSLALDGRWVMYGTMGGVKVAPEANFGKLIQNRGSIIASTLRNRDDSYKGKLCRLFERDCIPAFENETLVPVIDRVMKLSQVVEAHRYVESNASIGKVVLINDL
jgi:NADPH:quinone reductase-like Zn-dependent oxidoreductase